MVLGTYAYHWDETSECLGRSNYIDLHTEVLGGKGWWGVVVGVVGEVDRDSPIPPLDKAIFIHEISM